MMDLVVFVCFVVCLFLFGHLICLVVICNSVVMLFCYW